MSKLLRVAITQGDTNGVGYEVALKAFEDSTMFELCTPIIYGSPAVAAFHAKAMGIETPFTTIASADQAQEGRLNLLDIPGCTAEVHFGQAEAEAGAAALAALDRAMTDWRSGLYDVLVTAPINKATIHCEAFTFAGHTEYIENCVGEGAKALMILMNQGLRVALATTHLPIRQIAPAITEDTIIARATTLHNTLRRDLSVPCPRIAVLALNPHAGDNGVLGTEEKEVIAPAIEKLFGAGIQAFGPYPADGFFGSGAYRQFDGILAMYHDQGLAPFKALAVEDGVNFTAGLPIIRTSPDHGTAFDIAGRGEADAGSMRHAIYAAIDIYRARQNYDEPLANPLPKLFHERREDGERQRFAVRKGGFDPRAAREERMRKGNS